MKREDLKLNTVYRLTRDVTNPKPDRRANQDRLDEWTRLVTLPKGVRFFVEDLRRWWSGDEVVRAVLETQPMWKFAVLHCFDTRFRHNVTLARPNKDELDRDLRAQRELYDAIVDALEPAPVTLDVFFHAHQRELKVWDCTELLNSMLRNGTLTWEQLGGALDTLNAEAPEKRTEAEELPTPIYTP